MLESPPSASGIAKDEGQQTSKEHQVCISQGVLPFTLLYKAIFYLKMVWWKFWKRGSLDSMNMIKLCRKFIFRIFFPSCMYLHSKKWILDHDMYKRLSNINQKFFYPNTKNSGHLWLAYTELQGGFDMLQLISVDSCHFT